MKDIKTLIGSFKKVPVWKDFIKENFDRKTSNYNYADVSNIKVEYDNQTYFYPTKIILKDGYVRQKKNIQKVENTSLNNKPIKITETTSIIPFSFYKRNEKYTGELFECLDDILCDNDMKIKDYGFYSPELLSYRNTPLFSIDSKLRWSSYMLILEQEKPKTEVSKEAPAELKDILADYGINYNYENELNNYTIILFPMAFVKAIENRIQKKDGRESIFLVLEYNQLGLFFSSKFEITIDIIIKDFNQKIIYRKNYPIEFQKSKYQIVNIYPEKDGEIGYCSFSIKINNAIVDTSSGYYIRDIKVNIKP